MNLLVDTHLFVWLAVGDRRLSRAALAAVVDPVNTIYLSVVSRWEIALKEKRHAAFALPAPFEQLMEQSGFSPLPLEFDVPGRLASLPRHHGDPFDRILIAQAQHHGLAIVSSDRAFRRYDVELLW